MTHTPIGYNPGVETITYSVSGMHCGHCKAALEGELSLVPGVSVVEVDLPENLVLVRGDGLIDAELRAAIEEAGYEAA